MTFRDPEDASWAALFDAQIKANRVFFWGIANGILRDGGAAEDACQQAFLSAWERRKDLKAAAAIKGWLTKAVVSASLQAYRRRRREQRRAVPDPPAGSRDSLDQLQSSESVDSPAAVELRESILLALEALPEPQRTIVVLRSMERLSGVETMGIVGCSASEVSRQLHRGRATLRTLLAPWGTDMKE